MSDSISDNPTAGTVFPRAGVPQVTFVPPTDFDRVSDALSTPGRNLVVEGASGSGKTTLVTKSIEAADLLDSTLFLSARNPEHRELIHELPSMKDLGLVVIDDFHRLDDEQREALADFLKYLADTGSTDTKLVVIGINKAGDVLVRFSPDLNHRIDTIRPGRNRDELILELINKGESALNVTIAEKDDIAADSDGSFFVAQLLCYEACIRSHITRKSDRHRTTQVSYEAIKAGLVAELERALRDPCIAFARGNRQRTTGRAAYLHLLKWIGESPEMSINLREAALRNKKLKGSIGQIADNDYIQSLIDKHPELASYFHYEASTKVLAIEDPRLAFYLRHLDWDNFARACGFKGIEFESEYDYALSFAGPDARPAAFELFRELTDRHFEVFYDKNEEHRIVGENLEEYFGPIYSSRAAAILCLLSHEYPKRIWTVFESKQFRDRIGDGQVIPVWIDDVDRSAFDPTSSVGGFSIDTNADLETQVISICDALERREDERRIAAGGEANLFSDLL